MRALTTIPALGPPPSPAAPAPPSIVDMLAGAFPMPAGIDSAGPLYSVLSQFVHATPLAARHLQPGEWISLSAPTFAVAIEAAARGFTETAATAVAIACHPSPDLDQALTELNRRCDQVIIAAMGIHCIG